MQSEPRYPMSPVGLIVAFLGWLVLSWSALAEEGAPQPLEILVIGDEISAVVADELLGFFSADPDIDADVRLVSTGQSSLIEAWTADDFLESTLATGIWDHVILQEKMFLPAFAFLAEHPDRYGENQAVPEVVVVGSEDFWLGGEQLGRAVGQRPGTELTLLQSWPAQDGAAELTEFFPPADASSAAMSAFTRASLEGLRELLEAENESGNPFVRISELEAVWADLEDRLGEDLYGDDPLLAGPAMHYATAATLYRQLAQREVTNVAYDGVFESAVAAAYRSAVDMVLHDLDPLPDEDPPTTDEGGDGETMEPDPDLDEPNPDPEPEPEPEPIVAEPFDVLLVGDSYTEAIEEHLLGLFEFDPRAELRTLRVIGRGGEDLLALTQESGVLTDSLADEAWDAVVLEEANLQSGLAAVFENRRQAFDVGVPASYHVASYRFLNGGRLAIEAVLGQEGPSLVFFSPWPMQAGDPGLDQFPREMTPESMHGYLREGYDLLEGRVLPGGSDRVRLADAGAAWLEAEGALPEVDFYGDDGVFGALPGRYVAACVLYEAITEFRVLGNGYAAGLSAPTVEVLQGIAGEVSGIEPREPEAPDPDPGGGEGGGDGGEETDGGDGGEAPEVDPGEPLSVLLVGSRQLELVEDELLGFLQADAEVSPSITTIVDDDLRSISENASLKQQIRSGAWDVVILQEHQSQPAWGWIFDHHRREFFDAGVPANYVLGSYNFFSAANRLATEILSWSSARVLLSVSWAIDDSEGPLTDFPPQETSAEMQGYTDAAYAAFREKIPVAQRSRTSLVDVGGAWLRSRKWGPGVDLYDEATHDGGPKGHFLSAAVLYEGITGRLAAGNAYSGGDLRPADAQFLKTIAGVPDDTRGEFLGSKTLQVPSLDHIDPATPIVEYLNAGFDALVPAQPEEGDDELFQSHDLDGTSVWANNWTANLDFSGVAWDNGTAGTLVTDQYMVYARHFPRAAGSEVRFVDRNGEVVLRHVESQKFVWNTVMNVRTDIMVVRLDEPVPDTVAIYRLVPDDLEPDRLLGAKVINTYGRRKVYLSEVSRFQLFEIDSEPDFEVVTTRRNADVIDPAWDYALAFGDSGYPGFLLLDGELLLFSTHTFGGYGSKGPYYGGRGNQRGILEAIDDLSPEEE